MKKIFVLFVSLIISFVFVMPVLAEDMPYWYPKDYSDFTDYHGENLRRVVDDADIFTDEQEAILNERVNELVEKYDIGYVLFTDTDNHGLSPEEYSSDFLHFGGYGVGDDYGAVVFYISFEPGQRCWRTTSINSYESIFTYHVTYAIDEVVEDDILDGNYYEAFLKHTQVVEDVFANGGVLPQSYDKYFESSSEQEPFSAKNIIICIIVAAVIGAVVGGMRLSFCIDEMRVVVPVDAHEYLQKDSFVLRDKKVFYLYSTVKKTEKHKSSGSGGSSYSSGSSSGGSYSSGGRSF